MEKQEVATSINKARKGIAQYVEIMQLFPQVNVAEDSDFQRKFNSFYRIQRRPSIWYETYYSVFQQAKTKKPTFSSVLDLLYQSLNKCEPSFSSKLVATLDPGQPVWDKYVLEFTKINRPLYTSKNKHAEAKIAYTKLQQWYQTFLRSEDAKLIINTFDEMVKECDLISDLKKVDFVLWQMRA